MSRNLRPVAYCRDAKQFGRTGTEPTWVRAPGGTFRQLRAAVFQHHAGARLRAALSARELTQSAFAQLAGVKRPRLNEVLTGVRAMQLHDLATAAVLGPDALPDPERVHADLHKLRRELANGEPSRQEPDEAVGRPLSDVARFIADAEGGLAEVSEADRAALHEALMGFLKISDPRTLRLHARPQGPYSTEAVLVAGSGKTHAVVSMLNDWREEQQAGRAGRLGDDVFIIATTETDSQGRPIRAVGLPKYVDDGSDVRLDAPLEITWDDSGPHIRW